MEWDEVLTLLRNILEAEWASTPIAWQNENFDPAPDQPWIYAELLPVDTSGSLFGSDGLRVTSAHGLIALHVFTPTGTGTADAMRLAASVGSLLRHRTLSPGVETGPRSMSGAGSADDEGNWFRVSASIPIAVHCNT